MIVDAAVETDAARLLTWAVADLKQRGEPYGLAASKAKLYASEASVRAANNCVQAHGGYGYIDEYPAGKLLRDARVTTLYEGHQSDPEADHRTGAHQAVRVLGRGNASRRGMITPLQEVCK